MTHIRERQLRLFEAETRLKKVMERLEQNKECGNRVLIEIPKIKHLIK